MGMSRETRKRRLKPRDKKRPNMLITCSAFFFQDISDATYAQALVLQELALQVLVLQVLQVRQVPQVLRVLQVLQVLQVLRVPVPPLLSSQAQAVSFLVLMGSPLM